MLKMLFSSLKNVRIISARYENTILCGDFNVSVNDPYIWNFSVNLKGFKRLIKDPTCL